MEYDDEAEVTRYVWDYHCRLMTEFERGVGSALLMQLKVHAEDAQKVAMILRHRGLEGVPAAEAAMAEGFEPFRRRICRRVLAEHSAEVAINRCPACGRVLRTPKAKQCFWCGWDGH